MKTKSTNRKEKVCNFIRKHAKSIGLIMTIALLSTSVASAQRVAGQNAAFESSDVINENILKNPVTVQPVKNQVTAVPVIPLCPTISDLTTIDYSFDKVILGWDNNAQFDSIIFRYALHGSTSYRTISISGSPNPGFYMLQGLVAQTTYDFEVSTLCFTGATSGWTTPITITTFPEPAPRLAVNQRNTNHLRINPNPATSMTTISFSAPVGSVNQIQIVSPAGREVMKTQVVCTDGKIQVPINVSNITPGLYVVQVSNSTGMSSERLIIQ